MVDHEYEQKLALLDKILKDGLSKLLVEAKEKNFLEPPYGRMPYPTPLISEEAFIQQGGINCSDEDPEFNFEYGFDPLKFLADFILWSHPDTIENRRLRKVDASLNLQKRAQHARLQLFTAQSLCGSVRNQRSGILWGPFVSPLSVSSVACTCKPFKMGKVVVQLSYSHNFDEVLQTIEIAVTSEEGNEFPLPVKVVFNDLQPSTRYVVRCCLSSNPSIRKVVMVDPKKDDDNSSPPVGPVYSPEEVQYELGLDFPGQWGGYFMYSDFQTLPSEASSSSSAAASDTAMMEESHVRRKSGLPVAHRKQESAGSSSSLSFSPVQLLCYGQKAIDGQSSSSSSSVTSSDLSDRRSILGIDTSVPAVSVLLGDVLQHVHNITDEEKYNDPSSNELNNRSNALSYVRDIDSLLIHNPLFNEIHPASNTTLLSGSRIPLRSTGFVLGWCDRSEKSNYLLRAEEKVFKQYRHDLKRYEKKTAKSSSTVRGVDKSKSTPPPTNLLPVPTLKRLPLSDSVATLLQELPINDELFKDPVVVTTASSSSSSSKNTKPLQIPENVKGCRMMYRTLMMGPDVMLVVLDMRGMGPMGDYLGKEQAEWLRNVLMESTTVQWKVLLCGRSFGVAGLSSSSAAARDGGDGDGDGDGGMRRSISGGADGVTSSVMVGQNIDPTIEDDTEPPLVFLSSKQVHLPDDNNEPGDFRTITPITVELDETYGRPICSVQQVLAKFQETVKSNSSLPPSGTDNVSDSVLVASGVILLSSGLCSATHQLMAEAADSSHSHVEPDILSPAFVALYSSLIEPSIKDAKDNEEVDGIIRAQLLPTGDNVDEPSDLSMSEMALYAEVCLGTVPAQVRESRNDDGGGGDGDDNNGTFYFRDGFSASTLYSAYSNGTDQPAADSDRGEQLSSSSSSSSTAASHCKLQLLSDGKLQLSLFRVGPMAADRDEDSGPIYECTFHTIPAPASD